MALNRVVPGMTPGMKPAMTAGGFEGSRHEGGQREFGGGPRELPAAMQPGQRARWTLGSMVGRSSEMERLFLQMRYLANHLRVALIEGERGVGKELAARTLHELAGAKGGHGAHGRAFVACRAAEFFSQHDLAARLEEARGGTLYLAGVEALNGEQQARLLHLLGWMHGAQTKPGARHAGEETSIGVPRSLIVSSERSLRSMVLHGTFRNELHAQIAPVQLAIPALRDRRADIPMLVEQLLAGAVNAHARPMCGIMQEALPVLMGYAWPGNVEELKTVIEEAAARSEGEWLRRADVVLPGSLPARTSASSSYPALRAQGPGTSPVATWVAPAGQGARLAAVHPMHEGGSGVSSPRQPAPELDPNLDRAIMRHIRRVLGSVGGNKLRAARLLGISRSTLYRLLDAEAAGAPGEGRTVGKL